MIRWRLVRTDHLDGLVELCRAVYQDSENLPNDRRGADGFRYHLYLVKSDDIDADVGFAVFRGNGADVELLHCGILQRYRRMGAGTCILDEGEKEMVQAGYARMCVSTYNRWHIMLSMLTRRGYRIVETSYSDRRDDLRIDLRKTLGHKRELRFALTEKCNFRCLFCHNEGLGNSARGQMADEAIVPVLQEAVRQGYTDVTLTGGEPLLKKERLFAILNEFGRMPVPPNVTLVTNASCMDNGVIEHLSCYPGEKKVHVSLHAIDEKTFTEVTRCKTAGTFQKVVEQIESLTRAGIDVKMNHVVLRDFNHHHVAESVEFARSLGVKAIKLIELLVLPENHQDYRMYYDIDALRPQIEEIAVFQHTVGQRQSRFMLKDDARFIIELQRCTCAMGCSNCRENRDKTISSDLCYQPCFVRSSKHYLIRDPEKLRGIFRNGDRIIDGYAAKYRDSSPTLVQKETFVAHRHEFFFKIDDLERFRTFLVGEHFLRKNIMGFHEEYFRPRGCREEWLDFRRVLKFGWDYHNQSRAQMIYTDHEYRQLADGALETSTRFLKSSGPLQFDTAEEARHLLDRFDFIKYLELEWSIETWEQKGLRLNLAASGQKCTVKIEGKPTSLRQLTDIRAKYQGLMEPLTTPLMAFMMDDSNE